MKNKQYFWIALTTGVLAAIYFLIQYFINERLEYDSLIASIISFIGAYDFYRKSKNKTQG